VLLTVCFASAFEVIGFMF